MMRAVGPVTVCALVAVLGVPATQRLWAVKQLVHDTDAKPARALFFGAGWLTSIAKSNRPRR